MANEISLFGLDPLENLFHVVAQSDYQGRF